MQRGDIMKKRYGSNTDVVGIFIAILALLICGGLSVYNGELTGGFTELGFALLLSVYGFVFNKKNKKSFSEYVKMVTSRKEGMSSDAISKFPLPMAVLQINGQISWYNDLFAEMLGSNDLYNIVISDVMPDLKWSEILKSTGSIYTYAGYKGHKYNVVGDIIKADNSTDDKPIYTVLLYFIDKTEIETLRKRYEEDKIDMAIISIDNYDEFIQKMDDSDFQQTMAKINKYISSWVQESKAVIKKTERDRYIVLFEHKYLKEYIQKKFDVLEKVRALGEDMKMPISLSIGVGVGNTILDSEEYARGALDMAHGRGGDQAAVKDSSQYNFYGGIAKDYEKSTRVKTRAFAIAFKDFVENSDKVIFMGHSNADYDSLGAAIGLQRAVRTLGKTPYIVCDTTSSVDRIIDEISEVEEYNGMIISADEAAEIITMNTLLVILDTHRPSMLPSALLAERTTKVVLIDHHRRSTEFLSNISLLYHEPYASSTCEMATEILQYIDDANKMTPLEAKALYVGMVMDTKNFTVKTGVRTFEAASYLRRYGINTTDVRVLFNVEINDYIHRAELIKNAKPIHDNLLVTVAEEEYPNMRVLAAQTADEMLNLSGVKAAFIVYPNDGEINISARSLGDVNVQLILEAIGGGGHATIAGASFKTKDYDEVYEKLTGAIDAYMDENGKE